MNWNTVWLLYVHELRMLVRARRTVVMAIVIPVLLMPLMLLASKNANDRRDRALTGTTYLYSIEGSWADRVRDMLARARVDLATDTDEANDSLRKFRTQEITHGSGLANLEFPTIHFYLETFSGPEADSLTPPPPLKGVPLVRIVYRGNSDESTSASQLMESLLRYARRNDVNNMLVERGFAGDPQTLFKVVPASIATPAQVTGSTVGRFLTMFLVMLMLTGGSIAAMDIIAGEKERGTLETLLTTAAGRHEIVTAKQITICTVAIVITVLQAVNFLAYVKFKIVALPKNFALDIPTSTVFLLLLLFIPLAATIASVLLTVSAYAKTYKEAQMYFFPIYLCTLPFALAAVLPGVPLRSAIALVPLANVSVAVHEILMNRPDTPMIAVTFVVMTLTAVLLMRSSARLLAREDIVVSAQSESDVFPSGPVLFQRRVGVWFAVMWAIVFAAASNITRLQTFRAQLLFNEVGIFLGGTLLIIAVYRLNIRETLALRPVKWPVWIAIVIAAPAGMLMGVAVFKLLDRVLPISKEIGEQMNQMMVPNIPTWQLYLLVAVLPAVVEEIAFRGVLLNGLRRRFRLAVLPLVVGIIFGLFHFTLFRIGPAAFLGVLLTTIALLTGSIFPGIVFHGINNALALWTESHGWPIDALEWWHYGLATVIFGLAMWIIYRNRTPYPL